ncbi:MAG: glycosyltransferase [Calditrichaeota bacterium]|nr:MAG: glycosyltransferase [Calditrichota bacterium]
MKIAFVRTKVESTVFLDRGCDGGPLTPAELESLKISAKAGSSSKNMILALQEYGFIDQCEEWKFWAGPTINLPVPDGMPVRLFHCEDDLTSRDLARYLNANPAPDILWVEGTHLPAYLKQIFALCRDSFKIIYSKDWKPWKVRGLEQYDFCLVDEDWQIRKVKKHAPGVEAGVWDKLIDYQRLHIPLPEEKKYDVCYVAYFRRRKNHELLFESLAQLKDRPIRTLCVGDDRENRMERLKQWTRELGIEVHFMGEVPKVEVNRLMNQSRMGVMCAEDDAAPRVILEYMAADLPVLVNRRLLAGARYVGPEAGRVVPPEQFADGIRTMLDSLESFQPRRYFLEHFSKPRVVKKFVLLFRDWRLFEQEKLNALA